MKCNNCCSENSENAKFCSECGNELLFTSPSSPDQNTVTTTINPTEVIAAKTDQSKNITAQAAAHPSAFTQSKEFPGGTITCRAYIGTVHNTTTFSSSDTYGTGGGMTVGGWGSSSVKVQTKVTDHHQFWVRINDSDQDIQFKFMNLDFMVANGQQVIIIHAHSISDHRNDSGEGFCYIINKSNSMKFIRISLNKNGDFVPIVNFSRPLLSADQTKTRIKRMMGFVASPVVGLIVLNYSNSGIFGFITFVGLALFTQISFKDNSIRDTLHFIDSFKDKVIHNFN